MSTSERSLTERFEEAFAALNPNANIVVGVSGGLDSMALLELLYASGREPIVAHFNHQLRGAESDGDEAFVREQAEKRGLRIRTGRGDVRAEAKGISIEMAARKLRHEFLAEVACSLDADIVLAHHADDQMELVLMRARRGVEGYGAAGMREVSVSPSNPNVRVLRPLLGFRKEELVAFVKARGVPFREDSSNAQTDIERNRVRHKTIPGLRDLLGADFESEFLKHIQSMRANDDWWRQAARAWLSGDFAALPERLQKEILITQLESMGVRASGSVLDAILRSAGKPVTVAPDLIVSLGTAGQLIETAERVRREPLEINLHCDESPVEFAGGKLEWALINVEAVDLSRRDVLYFDAGEVNESATLRLAQEGDRVWLSGRSSERSVFDLLARHKVPKEKRGTTAVAEDRDGVIFWVEGLPVAEMFKVSSRTSFVLEWKWTRGEA